MQRSAASFPCEVSEADQNDTQRFTLLFYGMVISDIIQKQMLLAFKFFLAADSIPSEFRDPERLPQDVQTGTGVVIDYIRLSTYLPLLAKYETESKALAGELKERMGPFVSSPRNFYRDLWIDRRFLLMHLAPLTDLECLPDRTVYYHYEYQHLRQVKYPYETSCDDDSFHGFDGKLINYHVLPWSVRRLLCILGKVLHQLNLWNERMRDIILKRMREQNYNGTKVRALYVGGLLEAVTEYTHIPSDMESFSWRLHHEDPVLQRPHCFWQCNRHPLVHFQDDYLDN